MAYNKTNWQNSPNTTSPINATNLNNIETGIENNDKRLNGTAPMGNVVVDSIRSKNMFDKSTLIEGDITNAYTTIRVSSRQLLYLKAGTYTFSTNLPSTYNFALSVQSDGSPPLSSYPTYSYDSGWQTTSSKTFTLSVAGYFSIAIKKSDNSDISTSAVLNLKETYNYQLETGSTATTYVPYQNTNAGCKVLFKQSGTLSNITSQSTITLTENYKNFKYIDVLYCRYGAFSSSVRFNAEAQYSVMMNLMYSSGGVFRFYSTNLTFSGASVTLSDKILCNDLGTISATENNLIIYEVIGYK